MKLNSFKKCIYYIRLAYIHVLYMFYSFSGDKKFFLWPYDVCHVSTALQRDFKDLHVLLQILSSLGIVSTDRVYPQ